MLMLIFLAQWLMAQNETPEFKITGISDFKPNMKVEFIIPQKLMPDKKEEGEFSKTFEWAIDANGRFIKGESHDQKSLTCKLSKNAKSVPFVQLGRGSSWKLNVTHRFVQGRDQIDNPTDKPFSLEIEAYYSAIRKHDITFKQYFYTLAERLDTYAAGMTLSHPDGTELRLWCRGTCDVGCDQALPELISQEIGLVGWDYRIAVPSPKVSKTQAKTTKLGTQSSQDSFK